MRIVFCGSIFRTASSSAVQGSSISVNGVRCECVARSHGRCPPKHDLCCVNVTHRADPPLRSSLMNAVSGHQCAPRPPPRRRGSMVQTHRKRDPPICNLRHAIALRVAGGALPLFPAAFRSIVLSDGSPRERASPMTPTLLTRSSPGKACQIARYRPALRMPLRKTASALRRMST
jgi:hypothetical protein